MNWERSSWEHMNSEEMEFLVKCWNKRSREFIRSSGDKEAGRIPNVRRILEEVFAQGDGVIAIGELREAVQMAGVRGGKIKFYHLLQEIGVMSFMTSVGAGARDGRGRTQTYVVHPTQFQHVEIACKICQAKHDFIMGVVK